MKFLFEKSTCFAKKLSISVLVLITFQNLQAQNTFTGATDNDWNTASNWSGGVPSPTDDVIIPNNAVAIINGSGVAATAATVTVNTNAVLILQTGTMDLSGRFTINGGTFILSTGSTAKVSGFTTLPSSGLTLSGNLDLKGDTWVNGASVSSLSGKVYNFSSLTTNNSASISFASGGEINGPFDGVNEGAIASSINLTSGSISSLGATSTIKINGTFTIPAGTFAAGNSVISAFGTSTISAGSGIQLNDITVNAGSSLSLNTTGTFVSVSGSVTNNGTITINGLYQFADFTNSSTLTNNGTLLISSSFTNNGTYNSGNPSNLDFNGSGAMTVGGTFANPINNFIHSGNGNLTGNTSFTINGNYSNTGSGTGEFLSGTIIFAGTGKSIDGGVNGTTFNNMTISGTYTAANKVNLAGVLTLNGTGSFDADGASNNATFTIKSTSLTSTGSIAALSTPGNLTGNMTIERYYTPPSANGSWQYLAFPFSSTLYVSDLQAAGFQVNGHFASGAPLVNESMFTYVPNAANDATGWLGIGWGGGATSAYQLLNNVGYVALAYSDNTSNVISLRGTPAKGTINNIAITGGSGQYNLIPNPYPAPLNFDALQSANSGLLSTTIEVETNIVSAGVGNSTTGATATYTVGGPCANCSGSWGTWNGTIAPGQSFWVTATGSGNLTVNESMKASGTSTYIGRIAQQNPKDYLRISLISGKMKDESVILFREGAKETFNVVNDAKKRLSGDPVDGSLLRTYVNVGTLKPGTPDPLVFNFSPLLNSTTNKNIKLHVQVASSGTHSLKFTDLETFTLGYEFTLIDKFLNKQVAVKNGMEYAFTTTDLAASYALDRFELSIAREEIQTAANDESNKWMAYPNPSQGSFTISVPSAVNLDQIKILDSRGAAVVAGLNKTDTIISIDLSNHPAGLYIVNVQEGNLNHVVKLIKKL